MNGRLAALLILVALSGPAPGKPSSPAPVSQPATVVDAFHDALRRGDTADAAALLSDDALIFESGGVERSKAEYAAHHLRADAAFAKGVSSQVTRRSGGSSGPLAWVASEGRTKGTYKGKPVDLVTTESMVLRRERATWRIVHIHWSSTTAR